MGLLGHSKMDVASLLNMVASRVRLSMRTPNDAGAGSPLLGSCIRAVLYSQSNDMGILVLA